MCSLLSCLELSPPSFSLHLDIGHRAPIEICSLRWGAPTFLSLLPLLRPFVSIPPSLSHPHPYHHPSPHLPPGPASYPLPGAKTLNTFSLPPGRPTSPSLPPCLTPNTSVGVGGWRALRMGAGLSLTRTSEGVQGACVRSLGNTAIWIVVMEIKV